MSRGLLEQEIARLKLACDSYSRQLKMQQDELAELRSLHARSCAMVIPGVCDSADAYRKILGQAQERIKELKRMLGDHANES